MILFDAWALIGNELQNSKTMRLTRTNSLLISASLILALPKQTAHITLNIVDPTGAAIPQAEVEYKSSKAHDYRFVCADSVGRTALELAPGNYDLRVSSQGFRTLTKQLAVSGTGNQTVELELQVGSVTEQVMVISLAPVYQTTDKSLSVPDYSNDPVGFENAYYYYQDAVKAHPLNAGLHNSLGVAYAKRGQ